MAEFTYKAKDMQGIDHTGSVQSPDAHSAAAIIRKKGLIVVSLHPKTSAAEGFLGRFLNRVSFTELVIVTRQLAKWSAAD